MQRRHGAAWQRANYSPHLCRWLRHCRGGLLEFRVPSTIAGDSSTCATPITTEAVIIGAGPAGLFQVFELGLLGIKAHVVDSLKSPGGQCTELYPDKPIYDIPALPVCGAQELVDRLLQQIKPFGAEFHFGEEAVELRQAATDGRFRVVTQRRHRVRCRRGGDRRRRRLVPAAAPRRSKASTLSRDARFTTR